MLKNNENNLGGQIVITQQMLNHKKKLLKIKPVINNKIRPQSFKHKTNLNTGKHKLKKQQDFKEVEIFAKKVLNMKKGYIDTKKPVSLNYNKVKNKINNKNSNFIKSEHERNLISMKKRINNVNSIQNRKKNPYDPIVYPVYCFREDENKKEVKIDFFANKIKSKVPKFNNIKLKSKHQHFNNKKSTLTVKEINNINLENKNTNDDGESYLDNKNTNWTILKDLLPIGSKKDEYCYKNLEEELIELIIKHRIYKDDQLKVLFSNFYKKNSHLEYLHLEKIEESIMFELDN